MENRKPENGRFQKPRGGVLLTAVFLVGLMSVLSMLLLNNYRVVVEFTYRTRQHYEMKIMTYLFLADYPHLPEEQRQSGVVFYNTGKIAYQLEKEQLIVTAFVGQYQSIHYEPQKILIEATTETSSSNDDPTPSSITEISITEMKSSDKLKQ